MNILQKVIFYCTVITTHTAFALTSAEKLLVERIKDGVSLLVQENPEGWNKAAHELVDEIEKSYDPSERTQQNIGKTKQETPPPPPGSAMTKGTPPPPPGPKGSPPPPPPGQKAKALTKLPEKPKQIYNKAKLDLLSDEKLLALYEELFTDLPTNWNGQAVEKVEEKTKYGTKVNILYGMPIQAWTNNMSVLKKIIIARGLKSEAQIEKEITDRIVAVRAIKNVRPAAIDEQEEKPSEELKEADIVKLIKLLLDTPKITEMSWMVSVKGNIKSLFKLNPDLAREYENDFVKISDEKRFLPILKNPEHIPETIVRRMETE